VKQVLILSFWNPTPWMPFKGLFIHEQVKAICERNANILFLQVNILPSQTSLYHKTVSNETLFLSQKITINITSVFWKFIYVNPWLASKIIKQTLKKKAPSFKPALIHSNIIYPCGIAGHLLAQGFNSKHIISEHWSKAVSLLKHPVYKKIALDTYRNSKAVICVSQFLANSIRAVSGISNTMVIPNIIDTTLFGFEPKLKQNKDEIHFTCAAHWEAPKRLDLIIDSVDAFANETKKAVVLYVIGNGGQRHQYINKPKDNLRIQWLGYIPKQGIPAILHKTDYFLHASETETFSIVIVEALSTGTPVLASNVGAIPELINSKNGVLVENTLESWISGITEITSHKFDNPTITEGISGKYSPDAVAQKIEKVYNEVLDHIP
jgi:glycosyltransferase involved in cell wall biosynthesis